MQELFTEKELENAKYKDLLPLKCLYCDKTFFRSKDRIKNSKKYFPHINSTLDFCSNKCRHLGKIGKPRNRKKSEHHISKEESKRYLNVSCDYCNKDFLKSKAQIKVTKHNFCCHSCAAKYSNSHKTKGTRSSKLEKWIASQLIMIYPDLEFHFNRKDTIISELDIYIPSLKLAFELNGIFHYEPIYGADKLSSIKNNDNRKTQACLERGIELCIIDVSSLINFKEKKANKFLEIIKQIINKKYS